MTEEFTTKLFNSFDGMLVKKSEVQEVFSSLSLPAFIRDWFLKRYADKNGDVSIEFITEKVKEIMPGKAGWLGVLDTVMRGEKVRILAKIVVNLDIKSGVVSFALPDYGVTQAETFIPSDVWEKYKEGILASEGEVWGILELNYRSVKTGGNSSQGRI
jgi:ATP-dependent Lon protease